MLCRALRVPVVGTWHTSSLLGTCASSLMSPAPRFVHHHEERSQMELFLGLKRSRRAKANRNTHLNESFARTLRGRKTFLVKVSDDAEERAERAMTPAQLRVNMLKKGQNPYEEVAPTKWNEHTVAIHSMYDVLDAYVPPETPLPLSSTLSKPQVKAKEWRDRGLHRWRSYFRGTKMIKKKRGLEKFDVKAFGPEADRIYQAAHAALIARDKPALHKLVTETAFMKMWPDVENGSIVWRWLETCSPSRVVSVRSGEMPPGSGNLIAQLTVRIDSKQASTMGKDDMGHRDLQILAVFDRFGRLLLGSEDSPRRVVEYVVFESHVASLDGYWRLHDKIYPSWLPPKTPTM